MSSYDRQRSLPVQFVIGASAACGAVVKTRLQMQGELQRTGVYVKSYRGMTHAFFTIASNEGIRGLQKGLFLAYPYTIVMNGVRLGFYPAVKKSVGEVTGLNPNGLGAGLMAGAVTGAVGSFFANPFYITKTRLQSQSDFLPVGHQHKYRGGTHALMSLWKEEGLRGLFRGLNAAMLRIMVGSSVQLSSYDQIKKLVLWTGMKDNMYGHFASSLICSLLVAVVLNPFDVVTTRMFNQKVEGGKGALYSGIPDCMRKIAKAEGLAGFYKGLLPHCKMTTL